MTRWPIYAAFLLAAYLIVDITDALRAKCYEITPAENEMRQILLNKCKGDTWLLVRGKLTDDSGKETGDFTYRWHQLSLDPTEATLSYK